MITVTSTQKEDFTDVLTLINHVYGKENSPIKMEDIFTDLLGTNNMEHMRIIKADGKPVSVINYIINEININGCRMKAANIGAVCTHEDYRCRGYSNLILKDCLEHMKKEGVELLYVSGDISLYTKNNIHITGKMYRFNLDHNYLVKNQELLKNECEIKECGHEDLSLLAAIYDAETVKYCRDEQRFLDLAGRVPGVSVFHNTAKIFQVEEKGHVLGYFICAIGRKEEGSFHMEVIEYAGKRKAVLTGIIKTMLQLGAAGISGDVPGFDAAMLIALGEYQIDTIACNYPGTIKIINFSEFMQKLKPIYMQKESFEDIEFYECAENYGIKLGKLELKINNDKTMHNLLLGNDMELLNTDHITGDDALLDIIKNILPIPVPYPYGLNYI